MSNDNKSPNGWNEWSKYVLKALESNETDHREMKDILSQVRRDIAVLQVKSGLWGAVAGALAGAVPLIIALLFKFLS